MSQNRNNKDHITLFVCGDVMTGRGIDQVLTQPSDPTLHEPYMKSAVGYVELAEAKNGPIPRPVQPVYIWGDVLEEIQQTAPDLRIINLETSITVCDDYWPRKGIHYRMHPANIDCLTAADIDYCSLGNNHVLDWGYPGLHETMNTLEKAGIMYGGAGKNLRHAGQTTTFEISPKSRVILLSCGLSSSGIPSRWAAGPDQPGVHLLEDMSQMVVQRLETKIKALKQPGDIVILSLHWGGNWGYDIPREHISFAHRVIDQAAVDVIYGHSSHHVLGIEIYKNKPILYGCGDFLNDYEGISGYEGYRSDLSLMYFLTMDPTAGTLVQLRMVPTRTRRLQVHRAPSTDSAWLSDVLERESARFGTSIKKGDARSIIVTCN